MSAKRPTNPLTNREQRIVEANAHLRRAEGDGDSTAERSSGRLPGACPNPDCDLTPEVADLTQDGTLYIAHEEDGVGLASRTPRGETDGCRIDAEHDYTL